MQSMRITREKVCMIGFKTLITFLKCEQNTLESKVQVSSIGSGRRGLLDHDYVR